MLPKINAPSCKDITQEMVDDYVESLGGWDIDRDYPELMKEFGDTMESLGYGRPRRGPMGGDRR
jgi:hypothetical protein